MYCAPEFTDAKGKLVSPANELTDQVIKILRKDLGVTFSKQVKKGMAAEVYLANETDIYDVSRKLSFYLNPNKMIELKPFFDNIENKLREHYSSIKVYDRAFELKTQKGWDNNQVCDKLLTEGINVPDSTIKSWLNNTRVPTFYDKKQWFINHGF